jgi:predicted component of type VI protein secretion system
VQELQEFSSDSVAEQHTQLALLLELKFQWQLLLQMLQRHAASTSMNLADAMFTLLQMVQSVALAISQRRSHVAQMQ